MVKEYRKITDLLMRGEENPITSNQLARITGLNLRAVRELIEEARTDPDFLEVVCASTKGYFLANSPDEVVRWKHIAKARGRSIFRTIGNADRFLFRCGILPEQTEGQLSVESLLDK